MTVRNGRGFSALQRAEIAEIYRCQEMTVRNGRGFSALQRAEIAEIRTVHYTLIAPIFVSVLFNEPKLLKWLIAVARATGLRKFQCSSTSRNC